MASPAAALEEGLQAMLALKAPGVHRSIIEKLDKVCVENVQSESILIQKLFTHFKKAPATHKLGVLYVVDSVTRKWMNEAKALGQEINSSAPDGTFAGAVFKITELITVFLTDTIASAPENQKEKLKKLFNIWDKYQTFDPQILAPFKAKLESTTPDGDPPPSANIFGLQNMGSTATPSAAPPATSQPLPIASDVLASLASLTRAAQANPIPAAQLPTQVASQHQTPAQPYAPAQNPYPYSTSAPPPTNPTLPPGLPPNFQMPGSFPSLPASQPVSGYLLAATAPPAVAPLPHAVTPQTMPFPYTPPAPNGQVPSLGAPSMGASSLPPTNVAAAQPATQLDQQQILLIQALAAQNLPADQIAAIIQQVAAKNPAPAPAAAPAFPNGQGAAQYPPPAQNNHQGSVQQQTWNAPNNADSPRDRGFNSDRAHDRQRGRSRSRSPAGRWDSRDTRGGRDDRYGEYGRRPSPGRGRPDSRDGGQGRAPDGGSYRQRSPGRRGSTPMPDSQSRKFIEYDNSLPRDSIKVFSRTLFVGGVMAPESKLRDVFCRFGKVQTCIVNNDKRHAFVKMYSREDAARAKQGMENIKIPDMQGLRVRWGVGFGPRDCSDYQTGISVIPIQKLTEADNKWLLTAPWGGTGGQPIKGGMVVEEPDIEIGAGVSSKAISRRMQTDRGGRNGPRSSRQADDNNGPPNGFVAQGNRGGHGGHGGGRFNRRGGRDNHGRNDDRRNGNHNSYGNNNSFDANSQPAVPGFPYGIQTNPNGMPIFPEGFSFPAPQ